MIEILTRVAAPAVLILVEVEGPTRVSSIATSEADRDRLADWIASEPSRADLLRAALEESARYGDRATQWPDALLRDGDGVVGAIERLLDRQSASL